MACSTRLELARQPRYPLPKEGHRAQSHGRSRAGTLLDNEIADIHTRNPNLKESVGSVYSHRFADARAVLGPFLQADRR